MYQKGNFHQQINAIMVKVVIDTYVLVDFISEVGQHRGERNFGEVGFLAYDRDRTLQRVARGHHLAKFDIHHLLQQGSFFSPVPVPESSKIRSELPRV